MISSPNGLVLLSGVPGRIGVVAVVETALPLYVDVFSIVVVRRQLYIKERTSVGWSDQESTCRNEMVGNGRRGLRGVVLRLSCGGMGFRFRMEESKVDVVVDGDVSGDRGTECR